MEDQSCDNIKNNLKPNLNQLVQAVAQAVIQAHERQSLEDALHIRDELRRLPDYLMTDVLNDVMLVLVQQNPTLCRWFILDVVLRDADPDGKADVAERINLLLADLRSIQ